MSLMLLVSTLSIILSLESTLIPMTSCTASVRLRLRPLPTPWDRCMLGFPWLMPSPPDILTMLESSLTWSPLSITVSTILTWDSDSMDKVSEHLSAPDNDCLAIVNDKMNKMQYQSFILISTMKRIYIGEYESTFLSK